MRTLVAAREHRERNQAITRMRDDGVPMAEVARRFGMTRERARQIYEQFKDGEMEDPHSLRFLKGKALNCVRRAVGLDNPALIDLVSWMRRMNEESNWKVEMLKIKSVGYRSVKEVERFCRERGVPEDVLNPKLK
ncbi:MAG: hypothetical protein AB1295_04215 [Candidatus Micrarchaeota archaeon]